MESRPVEKPDKPAYHECQSYGTVSITSIIGKRFEKIDKLKKAILMDKVAAVVFFEFTDAFGNVNRVNLIAKLWEKFGIKGKLFLHLCSFLSDRTARIKINDLTGEWKESNLGMSAGSVLRALLFIVHVYDSPESRDPKFADDFKSVAVKGTVKELEETLQIPH